MTKKLTILFTFFLVTFFVYGQIDTVFFEINSYTVTKKGMEKLKNIPLISIELEGHADYRGNIDDNLALSKKRVNSVKNILLQKGHSSQNLTCRYFGENQPIGNDFSEKGNQKNRCVVLHYQIPSQDVKDNTKTVIIDKVEVVEQKEEVEEVVNNKVSHNTTLQPEVYTFINGTQQHFILKNGTEIFISPNTFNTSSNAEVKLSITAYITKSDFVLGGLHSMSGNNLLESTGMYNITASVNNSFIKIDSKKFITIQVPNVTGKTDFELFEGDVDENETLDWQPRKLRDDVLVRRIGVFSIQQEQANLLQLQREKKYDFSESVDFSNMRNLTVHKYDKNAEYTPYSSRWFKIDRYDLLTSRKLQKDSVQFQLHLEVENKKITSSKITLQEGKLTSEFKQKLLQIFENAKWKKKKKIVLDLDFVLGEKVTIPYYVKEYNASIGTVNTKKVVTMKVLKLGWINCDRFTSDRRKKEPVIVPVDKDTYVNLIFTDLNSVARASSRRDGKVTFNAVPVGEPYQIIVYKKTDQENYLVAKLDQKSDQPLTYKKMTIDQFITFLNTYY